MRSRMLYCFHIKSLIFYQCHHQSNLVPSPVLEKSVVLKGVHGILQNSETRAYKLLMKEMFNQKDDMNASILYDVDVGKVMW